jgi:hypothetical protein
LFPIQPPILNGVLALEPNFFIYDDKSLESTNHIFHVSSFRII